MSDPRLSKRDKRLIETCLELAKESDCKRHQHGAIVYKGGRVLGRGYNKYRNKPSDWMDAEGITIHAEIAAMSQVSPEKLRGSVVYVARRGKCAPHGLSKPCKNCEKALREAGVKAVVYTD